MEIQVQELGDSLAIQIPRSFAEHIQIGNGSVVDLTLSKGVLLATPVQNKRYTLAELIEIASVKEDSLGE